MELLESDKRAPKAGALLRCHKNVIGNRGERRLESSVWAGRPSFVAAQVAPRPVPDFLLARPNHFLFLLQQNAQSFGSMQGAAPALARVRPQKRFHPVRASSN
jgi:hypothetical protein